MANTYTQFSEMIPCETKEQQEWLMQEIAVAVYDDDGARHPACDLRADRENVWVYSEDSADIGALADIVADFQLRFEVDEPWTLTWAETCSKPRVGQFGGGGVVVYRGKVSWLNTWSWCEAEKGRMEVS